MTTTIPDLVDQHSEAAKTRFNRNGFVRTEYGISPCELQRVVAGKRGASPRLLRALERTHLIFFPGKPVTLLLPNQPPVLLGASMDSTSSPSRMAGLSL